jgi:Na+/H+ antiporter
LIVQEIELVLGLLLAIALLATLARKAGIPYPILMVLGGLLLAPTTQALGVPGIELDPEFVFLLFLPPLLFAAAYLSSIRDLRANLRPIALLSVGLVLVTTVVVAVVARTAIPALPWPVAFALGAIVSPPDAVAATSIMSRLGVPRRVVTVLEGESLVNDATALVAYRLAIAAALTGSFSLVEAGGRFLLVGVGGAAIGLAISVAAAWLLRRLNDPPVEVTLSLLLPYGAYLPAEWLGVSGVLSAVAAGLYLGRQRPRITNSDTRLLGSGVWQMVVFLLNGFVFVLIGLQLPQILGGLSERALPELIALGVLISLTVILVRIAWVFPATYLPRWLSASLRARDPAPPRRVVSIVAWAGMRGVVSLAAALAVPHTLPNGAPFPERDLVIFLTFCVILATLVGQGLSLPLLIRVLRIAPDDATAREEATARAAATDAAIARIDELEREWPTHGPLIRQLRSMYDHRAQHLPGSRDSPDVELDQELVEHKLIREAVIGAERDAVIELRDRGVIHDEVLRRLERDLDLEELRMEA